MPSTVADPSSLAEQSVTVQASDEHESSFFANKQVNVKLDDYNFLLWKQYVILMIRGHDLEHYLDESHPLPSKVITNANGELVVNHAYRRYRKQDSSLTSWLLSTIGPTVLPQLVGAETTAAIWSAAVKLYSTLSTTKIMNLHCRLRALKKGTSTISEYTTSIKEICDLLATSGSPVSEIEQIATVLNGLPVEYESFIAAIIVNREPHTFEYVTSMLKDAESRLLDPLRMPVGTNVTRYSGDRTHELTNSDRNVSRSSVESRSRDQRVSNQAGSRSYSRPRFQCQICGKLGHLADRCWHRFNKDFKGSHPQQLRQPDDDRAVNTQANVCCYVNHTTNECCDPFVSPNAGPAEGTADESADTAHINSLIAKGVISTTDKWYPNSGATHHLTYEQPTGQKAQSYTCNGRVYLGDGSMLKISHIDKSVIATSSRSLALT
ncbi:hypothetical protein HRI_003194100 [Hibiscus trionum]|uniref:CCHC-type domain-containing protein n=1 Tax=Hibiscus trionum TaxID=183268 RepID=A0A9W7IH50_HIBTR|nr:hypothetical protein HRI_003194100 [Hibiscus trionum]